jgi:hypothetical protein
VLVRTGGRYGAPGARSWLLIKHRDEWSGALDITEFAPRSVKSEGDFEDILAEDTPAVWLTNRPARGGDTGAMLARVIERAARLRAARAEPAARRPDPAKKASSGKSRPRERPGAASRARPKTGRKGR